MIGSIGLRLRPIKLAFLVEPNDKAALLRAIQISSFLWGGVYNPIIPCFKRRPTNWQNRGFREPSCDEILEGYLNAFDPDFIAPIGKCANRSFNVGHRMMISAADILSSVEDEG